MNMSETKLTKGWPGPKGKCDMCGTKKATHWFGDTSVALCNDPECARLNGENWRRAQEEAAADEDDRW